MVLWAIAPKKFWEENENLDDFYFKYLNNYSHEQSYNAYRSKVEKTWHMIVIYNSL